MAAGVLKKKNFYNLMWRDRYVRGGGGGVIWTVTPVAHSGLTPLANEKRNDGAQSHYSG